MSHIPSSASALTRRSFGGLSLAAVGAFALTACNSQADDGKGGGNTVRVGVVNENEVHRKLVEVAKQKHGIEVKLVAFTDYTQPNPALTNNDVDLNWFQHIAYLADYNEASGEDLTMIGTTEIIPLPLYSKKRQSVEEFEKGDTVAVPNDTVNQGRALNVLAKAGLITLKSESLRPEIRDVDEAASTVKVQAVSAEQTVNALESVAGAVINNTYSADAGLDPKTALTEDDPKDEAARPFVNGFAVRTKDKDNETYKKVAALYHDEAVLAESAKLSKDTSVAVELSEKEIKDVLTKYQDAIAAEGN